MPRVSKLKLPPIHTDESIGERLTRIRKDRGFTQVELAEKIGIIQSLVSSYESGALKLSAEMAVRFAMALEVATDDLLMPGTKGNGKNGKTPSRKILRRLEKIETLPRTQQIAVLKTIDNALELHTLKTGTR
ncbi:MAG: helix-turn-helix domain-containing protein [Bryobacteraceae bacterium]|jgi:transcriptional regulator with XRE-family HTH domain|nr:helix-turn-helix domain-containing protein [Bryobacteraceae bacterium]